MGILKQARMRLPSAYLNTGGRIGEDTSIVNPIATPAFEEVSYDIGPYNVDDYAAGHYPFLSQYTAGPDMTTAGNTYTPTRYAPTLESAGAAITGPSVAPAPEISEERLKGKLGLVGGDTGGQKLTRTAREGQIENAPWTDGGRGVQIRQGFKGPHAAQEYMYKGQQYGSMQDARKAAFLDQISDPYSDIYYLNHLPKHQAFDLINSKLGEYGIGSIESKKIANILVSQRPDGNTTTPVYGSGARNQFGVGTYNEESGAGGFNKGGIMGGMYKNTGGYVDLGGSIFGGAGGSADVGPYGGGIDFRGPNSLITTPLYASRPLSGRPLIGAAPPSQDTIEGLAPKPIGSYNLFSTTPEQIAFNKRNQLVSDANMLGNIDFTTTQLENFNRARMEPRGNSQVFDDKFLLHEISRDELPVDVLERLIFSDKGRDIVQAGNFLFGIIRGGGEGGSDKFYVNKTDSYQGISAPIVEQSFNRGGMIGYNVGGIPYGDMETHPGRPMGTDQVPVWAEEGEYIVTREGTEKFKPLLDAINDYRPPAGTEAKAMSQLDDLINKYAG